MAFPIPSQAGAGASGPQPIVPGSGSQPGQAPGLIQTPPLFQDGQLLEMWKRWKKESFDQRWIFERQWMRNVWYVLNRQWIYFDSKTGRWQDKRLAKWIPRPVTNFLKDGIQAVRASMAKVDYGTNARPLGDDQKNVITAGVADAYGPILHETHGMDRVLNTFDFWALACGNAWLHLGVERDRKHGTVEVRHSTCVKCGGDFTDDQIVDAKQKCPSCGAAEFTPTLDPETGQPVVDVKALPKGITMALSPFEIAFPLIYEDFELSPIAIRMRWRDKSYYEQHAELAQYVKGDQALNFGKTPQERTMQIFKTLPFQNDLGIASPYFAASGGANTDAEGVPEYDVWIKPCDDFPEGYVVRFAGDGNERVIHMESEALPGPLPFRDAKGNPLFPFFHARYETVGGRALGSSLIDPGIPLQDTINQLDSHIQMSIGRMANPVWLEPKGAEVEKFTGEPGLVVKWNPLVAGGNAKPERIPGENVTPSVFQYREMKKAELEELLGTNDLLKGQKPPAVDAYAALSLLKDLSQEKHGSYYKERGTAYRNWFKAALELEREFGPEERVKAILQPTKEWAFETFKKADLSGSVEILIEDGTMTPKSAIGQRAAIEHLNSLKLLDPTNSDQVMAIFELFGQTRLLPGLDAQVKEAWMNMDRFEKFLNQDPQTVDAVNRVDAANTKMGALTGQPPVTVGPLQYKRWYDPKVHRQELIKWCLSDRARNIFAKFPTAEAYVDAYLSQIDIALFQAQQGIVDAAGVILSPTQPGGPGGAPGAPGQQPAGNGGPMANSNRNAGGAGATSSGAAGTSQQNTQGNQPQQ